MSATSTLSKAGCINMPAHRPLPSATYTGVVRSYFSTARSQLSSTPGANASPSAPGFFSLKRISPNPRVRMAVGAGLAVLTAVDVYLVEKYWPQITGKGTKREGDA